MIIQFPQNNKSEEVPLATFKDFAFQIMLDKIEIHKVLFALVYYSNGGFTHSEVYNMPIYLRAFYIKQLEDAKKEEAEAVKSASKKGNTFKR